MKGRLIYAPKIVIDEIEQIAQECRIVGKRKNTKAMCEMVKYARVGREAERIMRLRF